MVKGSWRELIDPLLDSILDMTVGALPDPPPCGVTQFPLLIDRLSIIARAGHPLAGFRLPPRESLAAFPWIVGQVGTPLRMLWEVQFAKGVQLPAPVECGSVMVVGQILRESDFLTLLVRDQIALEIATGMLARIGPPLADSTRSASPRERSRAQRRRRLGSSSGSARRPDFRKTNSLRAKPIGR